MDKKKIVESVLEIFFFLAGLLVIYQILRKLYGGSWNAENILVSLVFLNLSATITLTILLTSIRSDLRSLKNQFRSLASDFKELYHTVTTHIADSRIHGR